VSNKEELQQSIGIGATSVHLQIARQMTLNMTTCSLLTQVEHQQICTQHKIIDCMHVLKEEVHLAARIVFPDLLKHLGPLGSSEVYRGGLVGSGDGIKAASVLMLNQLGNLHKPIISTVQAYHMYAHLHHKSSTE
jgi:hypothetical protein